MWFDLVIDRVGKSNQVWLDPFVWLTAVIFLILSYFTLPYFPRKNISYHSRTKEAKCKIRKGNIQCQTLPPPPPPFSQAFLATPLLTRLHYSWLPSSLDRAVMYIKIPRCCNISKTKLFCFLDSDIKEKNVKLVQILLVEWKLLFVRLQPDSVWHCLCFRKWKSPRFQI